MSALAPHVVPIFATPFGVVTLPQAQTLNSAVAELFAARAAREEGAPGGTPGRRVFVSRDDLLGWAEDPVRLTMREILAGVTSVATSISELSGEALATLEIQARAWFTVVRSNGCLPARSYPNTSWLGVYCVTAPQVSEERADSGVLRMHESRMETSFQDPVHQSNRAPYRRGHYTWRPVPGQMAVFPAGLIHEIAMVRAAGTLTLLTARARFAGASGAWMPPW
jgi:Putative 2OG-Fe(II) oxygenase